MGNRQAAPEIAVAAPTPEQVYAALRAGLEAGDVAPGGRLASERDLAARFGASRGAVRRALARLAGEGLIERRLGRAGSRARPLDLAPPRPDAAAPFASPQDVLEARLAVEPGFVDLVIARATEDDFARMAACLTRMEAAATQQAFREAGYAFHLEMARATRNPLLVHLFEVIIEARARAGWGKLRALNEKPEQRAAQVAKNWRTLGHLRGRDALAARRSLAEHLAQMLREVAGPHAIGEGAAATMGEP
ncbi:FadR/GntR family transcriptional regulator [Falsiroseomonas sp. HW251]|uniref:FadR/GntR family transcriptional regulator n=1 Tax=Falsiroseomonas sp. HW251 TaxID=3390998 RepID=UPI003D315D42